MARLEADLVRLNSTNRRYRMLAVPMLMLACLPYVLGGALRDDTISAKHVKTESISLMRGERLLANFGISNGGPAGREGAFLELCDGQQRSVISLRANDPAGPSVTIRNQTSAGVFPVIRLGSTPRGDAQLITANKAGKMVAEIGVDLAGRGLVGLLDDRSPGGLAGFMGGSSLTPLKRIALMNADAGGSGALGINDSNGRLMVSLGVSDGLQSLATARMKGTAIRASNLSGRLTVQNQAGAVIFKAP